MEKKHIDAIQQKIASHITTIQKQKNLGNEFIFLSEDKKNVTMREFELMTDQLSDAGYLSEQHSNALFELYENNPTDYLIKTLHSEIKEVYDFALNEKSFIESKIITMNNLKSSELYYNPSISNEERKDVLNDIQKMYDAMETSDMLSQKNINDIQAAFSGIRNDMSLMQFRDEIANLYELYEVKEYNQKPIEKNVEKEYQREENKMNMSFKEESLKTDISIAEFVNAMEQVGVSQKEQAKILASILNTKEEMERDFHLGDEIYTAFGKARDTSREKLNDLGYLIRDTKVGIIKKMNEFRDVLDTSKKTLIQLGKNAIEEVKSKILSFQERYHEYMNERDKRIIQKNDKIIDKIIGFSQTRAKAAALVRNVSVVFQNKDFDMSYKPELTKREIAKIEKLTNDIGSRLTARAERYAIDNANKMDRITDNAVKRTLLAKEIAEMSKELGGRKIPIALADRETGELRPYPFENFRADYENNFEYQMANESKQEGKYEVLLMSPNSNDNNILAAYNNKDILFNAMLAYEFINEWEYRDNRSIDIAENIEGMSLEDIEEYNNIGKDEMNKDIENENIENENIENDIDIEGIDTDDIDL